MIRCDDEDGDEYDYTLPTRFTCGQRCTCCALDDDDEDEDDDDTNV